MTIDKSGLAFLEETQPQACTLINAALRKESHTHAWLFYGGDSVMKKEAAIRMAQCLFLQKETLSSLESLEEDEDVIAHRIEEEKYPDFLLIDGRHKDLSNKTEKELELLSKNYSKDGKRKTMISKEETDAIQERFSSSAKVGTRKVYVIDACDNMSVSAANNMLKFLEEPPEETYAILTVNQISKLLSTIVSRCVLVPFMPVSEKERFKLGVNEGIDEEDAYLLSKVENLPYGYADMTAYSPYQNAKEMLKQALNVNGDRGLLLVDYENRYKQKATGNTDAKVLNMDTVSLFLSMAYGYCKDVLAFSLNGPAWYSKAVATEANKANRIAIYSKIMKILLDTKDQINASYDLSLLLAGCVYQVEEVCK